MTAVYTGAAFPTLLLSGCSINDVSVRLAETREAIWYNRKDWTQASALYKVAVRAHPLYDVVLHGFKVRARKSAMSALLKFEALRAWEFNLLSTEGEQGLDKVSAMVTKGAKRRAQRP